MNHACPDLFLMMLSEWWINYLYLSCIYLIFILFTLLLFTLFANKFSLGHHLQASTELVNPPFTNTFTFHSWKWNDKVSLVDCALITKVTAISLKYQHDK